MKVVEILKLGQNWLELLQDSCIKIEDVRFIAMYEEYQSMVAAGEKKSYVVACLSEKYKVSERQVYYVIKRFGSDCKICAV